LLSQSNRRRIASEAFGELDEVIDRMVRDRLGTSQRDDLLGRLLAARDSETNEKLTKREIRDELVTMLVAGFDTTTNVLCWTCYLLSQNPTADRKVHSELSTVLVERQPNNEDLHRLPYIRTVIEESIRLYPPVPIMERQAIGDDEILGHRIKAGSSIIISPWLLHRNPKLWDHPLVFNPERFRPELAAKRQRFAYLPFGGGPRTCVGAAYGLTEATVFLSSILQRFRLRLKPGFRVEPQALITLRPRYGLKMILEPR
jgi:cytochrome P450